MSERGFRVTTAAAILAIVALASAGSAQNARAPEAQQPASVTRADSALDAATRDLAAQLRCPVCQGLSIQDSPSELSQQMRDLVRQQLQEGKTPDQVKQYFVARYGQWILMAPPASGFNWLVYTLPWLALAAGVVLIVVLVRRWTSPEGPLEAPEALPSHDPSEATR
jgi:cytochrome c-type biogenesis protein CcmH